MQTTDAAQTLRIDAVPKVTGQAVFTEDLPLAPGTRYGAIVQNHRGSSGWQRREGSLQPTTSLRKNNTVESVEGFNLTE